MESPSGLKACAPAQTLTFRFNAQDVIDTSQKYWFDFPSNSYDWTRQPGSKFQFSVNDIFEFKPNDTQSGIQIYYQKEPFYNGKEFDNTTFGNEQLWEFIPYGKVNIPYMHGNWGYKSLHYANLDTGNTHRFVLHTKTEAADFEVINAEATNIGKVANLGDNACITMKIKNPCNFIPKNFFLRFTLEEFPPGYFLEHFQTICSFDIIGKTPEMEHTILKDCTLVEGYDGIRYYSASFIFSDDDLIEDETFTLKYCGVQMLNFNEIDFTFEVFTDYNKNWNSHTKHLGNITANFKVNLEELTFDEPHIETTVVENGINKKEFLWTNLKSTEDIKLVKETMFDLDLSEYGEIISDVSIRFASNNMNHIVQAVQVSTVDSGIKWRVILPIEIHVLDSFDIGVRIPTNQLPQSLDNPFIINILSTKHISMYKLVFAIGMMSVGIEGSISQKNIGYRTRLSIKLDRLSYFTGLFDYTLKLKDKLKIDKSIIRVLMNGELLDESTGDYIINETTNTISFNNVDVKAKDVMNLEIDNLIVGPFDANKGSVDFEVFQNGIVVGHEDILIEPKMINLEVSYVKRIKIADDTFHLHMEFFYDNPFDIDHWVSIEFPKIYVNLDFNEWWLDTNFPVENDSRVAPIFVEENEQFVKYKYKNLLSKAAHGTPLLLNIKSDHRNIASTTYFYIFLYADSNVVSGLDDPSNNLFISKQLRLTIEDFCDIGCSSCYFNSCHGCQEPYEFNDGMCRITN
jgi:hypothetical protein